MNDDVLLDLLRRFQQEDVQYVLVGGHDREALERLRAQLRRED